MINRPMPSKSDVDLLRARLAASLSSLSAVQTEIEIDDMVTAAEDAAFDEQRAEAARRGELGPEWQKIQQRIDLGTTTLDDVFSGRDDSPEAIALLAKSRATLQETVRDIQEADDDDPTLLAISELRMRNAAFDERMTRLRATFEGDIR